MLIDSHCHLHDREFFDEEQAEEMIERARKVGIKKIICIGTSHQDSLIARDFANNHNDVYWTYGIHPEATSEFHSGSRPAGPSPWAAGANSRAAALRNPPNQNSLVAIGEIGLDYHHDSASRNAQIKLFEEMLQLATNNDLPVSFHVREAFDDFFPVVENFPSIRGVVHSFTDSKKVLKRILNETDFYVGVNGLATYSTLPLPPLDRILLETDAPFLTPVSFRGIINEPAYIKEVAEWLSQRIGLEFKIIEAETTKNARKLFGI